MTRIGVVGLRRGLALARACRVAGLRVVGVCDRDPETLARGAEALGVEASEDFDSLLGRELDGVVLANHFDEHAPLAIRALEAGCDVLSETAACRTIAEGVELIAAVERTGRVYAFAENYPFKPHVQDMRRRFASGELGALQYAECCAATSPTPCDAGSPPPSTSSAASIVGIQGLRSVLRDAAFVEIPDLRRPEVRAAWASDDWYGEELERDRRPPGS